MPLSNKELEVLNTPEDYWKRARPDLLRSEFRSLKKELREKMQSVKGDKMSGLKDARSRSKQRQERMQTDQHLKEALVRITELEAHMKAIKALKDSKSGYVISPRQRSGTSEATVIACATDWHLGATVRPEQVNGLNTYNVAVAKRRINNFFERTVRLTEKERQDIQIDELVLFLGGDLIDGALHLDTIMTNEIAEPIRQAVMCQELIEAGLKYLVEHGKYKRITVICCDGNHGRITQKMHSNSRQGNALEYFMYYNLAHRFPKLNWVMADGLHVYLKMYDFSVRFHHGDTIGFGGVQGPYTYLNRRIYQWDQAQKADYSIQGHLHCYTVGTRRWLINGSLIGYSPYAMTFGGEFQPPIQAFILMDKKRGPTVQIPILVD